MNTKVKKSSFITGWLIILILITVSILLMISPQVQADYNQSSYVTKDGQYQYSLTNVVYNENNEIAYAEVRLEKYRLTQNEGIVEVPSMIEEYKVTIIGNGAFSNCATTQVKLPSTIQYISSNAFVNCSKLQTVNIPASVIRIDPKAFNECIKLEKVEVNEENEYYSNQNNDGMVYNKEGNKLVYYPSGKSETSFTIPQGVTAIENYAFVGYSNLKEIIIPTWVRTIGEGAFCESKSLQTINVESNHSSYSSTDGILFNKAGTKLISCPPAYQKNTVAINSNVLELGNRAFENCTKLTNITMEDKIKTIGNSVFKGCTKLYNCNLPESITQIGTYVFANCTNIYLAEFPSGLTEIPEGTFFNCNQMKKVNLPEGITKIGDFAFTDCKTLTQIEIPVNVTEIGTYAFEGCTSIAEIILQENLTKIGDYAFANCTNLTKTLMPQEITTIGKNIFENAENVTAYVKSGSYSYTYAIQNNINKEVDSTAPAVTNETKSPKEVTNQNIVVTLECNEEVRLPKATKTTWTYSQKNNKKIIETTYTQNLTEEIKLVDLVGNEVKRTITINNIDRTPPTATITMDKDAYKSGEIAKITVKFDKDIKDGTPRILITGVSTLEKTNMTKVSAREYTYQYRVPNIAGTQTIVISDACDLPGNKVNDTKKTFTIMPTITGLTIENAPDRIVYIQGENFQKAGMKVKVAYNNGTTKDITNYEILNGENLTLDQKSVTISYTEEEITKTTTQQIIVVEKMLTEIKLIKYPNNTSYIAEQDFDATGMEINAIYSDETSEKITNYTIVNGKNLTTETKSIAIIYTENTITKSLEIPITVAKKELSQINITTAPKKTSYIEEQNFDKTGMVVTATYNNGFSNEITDYTIIDGENLVANQTTVTISYTEDNKKATTTQKITVNKKVLTKIQITTPPTKQIYIEEQNFDKTGMVVTATYDNGKSKQVTNYTVTNGTNLQVGQKIVTISYTENGITKTTTQNITVNQKQLQSIKITKTPNKITYVKGEEFDATGMQVTATYDNGNTKQVTNYKIYDANNLVVGNNIITISYTENNITQITTLNITVTEKLEISLNKYNEIVKDEIKYINNINPNTTIEELTQNIITNGTITISNKNTQITNTKEKLTTGMKITITFNNEKQEYTIVVNGDTNGDGTCDLKDLLQINKHRLNKVLLQNEYLLAADVNGDNNVDLTDLLQVNKYRLGKIKNLQIF